VGVVVATTKAVIARLLAVSLHDGRDSAARATTLAAATRVRLPSTAVETLFSELDGCTGLFPKREKGRACLPAGAALQTVYCFPALLVTASITRSRLKLPGFWRGGNSLKLCSHWPT
jgi:hypothetical protein